ncbi:hypothetical protein GRI38_04470 [Altererythrobacter aurantiacus]|uniref:DOMON-like domain-containing protein n=1 Tax=Parapontixanthobacter aurantiacus TaxID=1463599 RepID=A0A844ZE39_9SPHN|nr:hypothetical protein [Parapontixanthobacter aurantiacus]MXO85277.1 hypothetical protein [Parapontixanthobacter aurantiacus]
MSGIEAELHPTPTGCRAAFVIAGAFDNLVIPGRETPTRRDELWRTTCCEIFWQPKADTSYREINLSPSTCWAAYDFADYRAKRQDAALDRIVVWSERAEDSLTLKAEIEGIFKLPASIGLSTVIEESDGRMQYWALAFPEGPPDFHRASSRRLHVAGRL